MKNMGEKMFKVFVVEIILFMDRGINTKVNKRTTQIHPKGSTGENVKRVNKGTN